MNINDYVSINLAIVVGFLACGYFKILNLMTINSLAFIILIHLSFLNLVATLIANLIFYIIEKNGEKA